MTSEHTKLGVLIPVVGGLNASVLFLVVGTALDIRFGYDNHDLDGSALLLGFVGLYLIALIIGVPLGLGLAHCARVLNMSILGARRGALLGAMLGAVAVALLSILHPPTACWPAAIALFLGYELTGGILAQRMIPDEN
jgi:hypothetical protein